MNLRIDMVTNLAMRQAKGERDGLRDALAKERSRIVFAGWGMCVWVEGRSCRPSPEERG